MEISNLIRGFRSVLWQADRRTKGARRFHTTNASRLASVDVLEDRLLLTADFGDAPDTTAAIGVNNY